MGYYGAGSPPYNQRLKIKFSPQLEVDSFISNMDFFISNGAISNSVGELLFYTNGGHIADITGDTMFNGRDLNMSNCSTTYAPTGIPVPQSVIILPAPADTNIFFLFHLTCDLDSSPLGEPRRLMYSTVDMRLNGGLGAVVQKNVPIFYDQLAYGLMTSCKHGNGNDWWILVPQYQTNVYHRILLTASGIIADTIQHGSTHPGQSHPNQAVFSPNGEWYCRYDVNTGMSLMEFDRCTGTLSNELFKPASYFPNTNLFSGGCEFSASSRFVYITSIMQINQFDLSATDILNSQVTVAEIDTFNCPFNVNFTWPTLAPDGKIYVNSSAGNYCISYIDQPDSPGVACNVVKHGLTFPISIANLSAFPNNPNFRLGSKDCLTGVSETEKSNVEVYPNPASGFIRIKIKSDQVINYQINFFDVVGKLVKSFLIPGKFIDKEIDISDLTKGLYFYSVQSQRQSLNGYLIKR